MRIWRALEEVPAGTRSALTIGVFDGVHRGHQSLMRAVVAEARARSATPVVVTFDRHPLEIIAPGKEPPLLTTLEQRARVMAGVGIEAMLVLRFDEELRTQSPEAFVREVLVRALGCAHAVVGANFRFGHKQAGTIETLADLGAAYGFGVTIFALVDEASETVSSSMIRRHVAEGAVERAAVELDRPFRIAGVVTTGASRGRSLGFPTANLAVPPRMLLPKLGVYAGWLWWKGVRHPAVINVGVNPTFEDRTSPVVEAYVLDFDADLYGAEVEVEFAHRLRDELRFPTAEALVEQIGRDVEQARALLGARGSDPGAPI